MKKHNKNTKSESAKKQLVKTGSRSRKTMNGSKEIQALAQLLSHELQERSSQGQAVMAAASEVAFYAVLPPSIVGDPAVTCVHGIA